MDSNDKHDQSRSVLDDICLVPAPQIRRAWGLCETTMWGLEKKGLLHPVRIGRRKYYMLRELRKFLDEAKHAGPISVPWRPAAPTHSKP
jgi:hypothetical protein